MGMLSGSDLACLSRYLFGCSSESSSELQLGSGSIPQLAEPSAGIWVVNSFVCSVDASAGPMVSTETSVAPF